VHCEDAAGCPAGWTCSTVGITNIDGQGQTSAGGSSSLCLRP
jgi:hypothetical protein